MSRTMIAVLTLAALSACGRSDRRDMATADSLSRDLQLAPVDSTAELNDTAASTPAPAAPAPAAKPSRPAATPRPGSPRASTPSPSKPSAPAPSAAPAARASLAAGTSLTATTTAEIRSNKNKVGDTVTATIENDVKDSGGRVVIPAGSAVVLEVTAIKESENKSDKTGTLTLKPTAVSINGQSYPVTASIQHVDTRLEGRKTSAGDVAKPAAGAAVGAVVGRVLGGSTKGAVIGGVIGGAVGAQRAVETKDRDVVLPTGTAVTLVLDQSFKPGS
jgi:outer membrane protein with glycine zipper